MKMRRIVSAESKAGVVMQVSDVLDTETADRVTNIWGFDKIPQLPLSPEQVLGEYKRLGIFGPKDSIRVDLQVVPPETAGATGSRKLDGQDRLSGTGGGGRCKASTAVRCTGPTPSISRWCSRAKWISPIREKTAKCTRPQPRKAISSCRTAPFTNLSTVRTTLA